MVGVKSPKTALSKLKRRGLATTIEMNRWLITEKGQELLSDGQKQLEQLGRKVAPSEDGELLTEGDVFKDVGRNLFPYISEQRLDSIVYYVEELTGFRSPEAIWNALCDYKLTPRNKFTWLRVYFKKVDPQAPMPEMLLEKRSLFLKDGEYIY